MCVRVVESVCVRLCVWGMCILAVCVIACESEGMIVSVCLRVFVCVFCICTCVMCLWVRNKKNDNDRS